MGEGGRWKKGPESSWGGGGVNGMRGVNGESESVEV